MKSQRKSRVKRTGLGGKRGGELSISDGPLFELWEPRSLGRRVGKGEKGLPGREIQLD